MSVIKHYLTGIWIIWGFPLFAQPAGIALPEVTLRQCYEAARTSYPLLRQQALLQQTGDVAVASLYTNRRLPQLSVNGQATWQSEVTKLPIELPNLSIPTLSKDQYKLTADVSYALYDGGLTRLQSDVQRASTATAQQQVEVELNRLNDQVNAFFLNALLTDENLRLTQTMLTDLRNRIDKLSASVRFGTASPMNLDVLKAEALRSEQRLAELNATRRGLRDALHILTDLAIFRVICQLSNRLIANCLLAGSIWCLLFHPISNATLALPIRLRCNYWSMP
ncbi:TolC family protein [Spirosoma sp. SC4-14]|uniref:TolC family protein n=1 Tax=Spirosoma sp. SC4-14 TaxID=3128900 RepID=UPI0030CE3DD0